MDDNLNISSTNYYQATNLETTGSTIASISGTSNQSNTLAVNVTGWGWWTDYYYPQVIRQSYPVYIQERAQDKGKQAFEIIKVLKDKKLVRLETVGDFIEAMDCLIKIL